MKRLTLLALVTLSLTGCGVIRARQPAESAIKYWIDQRTEICFATWGDAWDTEGIACVPCTEEVLNLADPMHGPRPTWVFE